MIRMALMKLDDLERSGLPFSTQQLDKPLGLLLAG